MNTGRHAFKSEAVLSGTCAGDQLLQAPGPACERRAFSGVAGKARHNATGQCCTSQVIWSGRDLAGSSVHK